MRAGLRRAAQFALLLAVFQGVPRVAHAQYVPPNNRDATAMELVGGNMLVGGLTAATHAMLAGKDPMRAFAKGALGGAVMLAGKRYAVEPGTGWLGAALAGTGTSMVHNAGRGAGMFEELTLPLPGLRVRFLPRAEQKVRVAVNLYEASLVAEAVWRDDLTLDWAHSRATGTAVFSTVHRHVVVEGTKVNGAAVGPVSVVSVFANDYDQTARHEVVHAYQAWFAQEAWGRPIEQFARARLPYADLIPSWLELGLGAPTLAVIEGSLVGRSGTHHLKEAEAGLLMQR